MCRDVRQPAYPRRSKTIAITPGIATAADGHVQRRSRAAGIGEAGSKPDALDETLGGEHGVDRTGRVAIPGVIAMVFDLRG